VNGQQSHYNLSRSAERQPLFAQENSNFSLMDGLGNELQKLTKRAFDQKKSMLKGSMMYKPHTPIALP